LADHEEGVVLEVDRGILMAGFDRRVETLQGQQGSREVIDWREA
jgi:hypothetical protein